MQDIKIYYISKKEHAYTMNIYLQDWGKGLENKIELLAYEDIFAEEAFIPGVYIFTDVDRLTNAQMKLVSGIWNQLNSDKTGFLTLNHPAKTMDRYRLLKKLYEKGINSFDVFKLNEFKLPIKKPVFIRTIQDHTGSFTQLIDNDSDYNEIIGTILTKGYNPADLMIVEYCETLSTQGLYKKYSAFVIGDLVIPRHLIFSENWILKYPDLLEPKLLEEENEYLKNNPHEKEILEVFKLSNTEYGRIDYSIPDGKLEVWEINTNPIILLPKDKYEKVHLPAQRIFEKNIKSAFNNLTINLSYTKPIKPCLDIDILNKIIKDLD